jgi:hypothetical protein
MLETGSDGTGRFAKGGGELRGGLGALGPEGEVVLEGPGACHGGDIYCVALR